MSRMNALSYEITNNMKYIGKEGCKKLVFYIPLLFISPAV